MFILSLDVEVENWQVNRKGRQIVLHARKDDIFIVINIYAPNDLKKQFEFFKTLKISENMLMKTSL